MHHVRVALDDHVLGELDGADPGDAAAIIAPEVEQLGVLGAFLLGLIMAAAGRDAGIDPRTLLFLKVGVCGGFTTFSTFALESHTLLSGGKPGVALAYMLLSVVLCVLAVFGAGSLVKS